MANQVFVSPSNVFLPQATGQIIAYVRNPSAFKLNQWVQNIRTPKVLGVYAKFDRDHQARIVTDAEFAWEDGDERPMGRHNLGRFQWIEFRCFRRDYPFSLGNMAVEQAEAFKPLLYQAQSAAQQAMTNRTNRVVSMCETVANWGDNTKDANTLNGGRGTWRTASNDMASGNYLAIKRSLLGALKEINKATNAVVQPSDMVLVVSPGLAEAMAETSEIHDYLARQSGSLAVLEGKDPNLMAWGIPSVLYGIPVVVEDCVRVTSRPNTGADASSTHGGAGTRVYAKSDTSAFLVSRKGGLDGAYGAPSFSTVQCYFYKWEMAVQTFNDARNERVDGHVVECFKEVLAAPEAGYLITGTI